MKCFYIALSCLMLACNAKQKNNPSATSESAKSVDAAHLITMDGIGDIKEGIYTAVLGKALFEDKHDIERKLDELFPAIAAYLDKNLPSVLFSEIISEYRQEWGKDAEWSGNNIEAMLKGVSVSQSWNQFVKWAREHESAGSENIPQILALYLSAYDKGCENDGRAC